MLPVVLAMVMLAACATRMPPPEAPPQCDPVADEAVRQGDWELALKEHQRVVREQPGNCLACYHLGFIWGQLGDREKEVRFYEAAIDCGYTDDDRLFFNLGMAYTERGDSRRALAALERAAGLNADNPDNFFGLGVANQLAGRQAEAEAALLDALRLDDGHADARLALIRLYLDQGRWEDARRQLERIKPGDPGYETASELRQLLESREAEAYRRDETR
jgi:tetratricopeptide (TPR) repeat protein